MLPSYVELCPGVDCTGPAVAVMGVSGLGELLVSGLRNAILTVFIGVVNGS